MEFNKNEQMLFKLIGYSDDPYSKEEIVELKGKIESYIVNNIDNEKDCNLVKTAKKLINKLDDYYNNTNTIYYLEDKFEYDDDIDEHSLVLFKEENNVDYKYNYSTGKWIFDNTLFDFIAGERYASKISEDKVKELIESYKKES